MENIRKTLFWCTVMGFAVMLIWFGMIVFAGEAIHAFHSDLGTMRMVPIEWFMAANYLGIGMWKMAVILFFAIPWLAIKIVGTDHT